MTAPRLVDLLFWLFAAGSLLAAWRVFRADSMMRAAYWLLASFAGVAGIFLLLGAEFLGFILVLMMAGEMTIMVVFMVMFMMNPAGLNPMTMVHQHRVSIGAGVLAFLGLGAVGLFASFPDAPVADTTRATAELGRELLGESMLAFQTAGVVLLSTMIGALALASKRGRYGDAEAGSVEPELTPGRKKGRAMATVQAEPEEDEHAGMDMGEMKMDHAGMAMDPGGMEPGTATGHDTGDHDATGDTHGSEQSPGEEDEHGGHG